MMKRYGLILASLAFLSLISRWIPVPAIIAQGVSQRASAYAEWRHTDRRGHHAELLHRVDVHEFRGHGHGDGFGHKLELGNERHAERVSIVAEFGTRDRDHAGG